MKTYRIAVIAGDGIGKEVIPAGIAALEAVTKGTDVAFAFTDLPWGCEFYLKHGKMLDEDGFDRLAKFDAIYLGAIGAPTVRAVVRDDGQFVFTSVGLILADAEAELVAPLPAEVQTYAHIEIGVGTASTQIHAARQFAAFVTGATALPILRQFGVEREM